MTVIRLAQVDQARRCGFAAAAAAAAAAIFDAIAVAVYKLIWDIQHSQGTAATHCHQQLQLWQPLFLLGGCCCCCLCCCGGSGVATVPLTPLTISYHETHIMNIA
jgi:hypothetical protein